MFFFKFTDTFPFLFVTMRYKRHMASVKQSIIPVVVFTVRLYQPYMAIVSREISLNFNKDHICFLICDESDLHF